MRTPFEGQQRPKPVSAPVVMEVMNEECPNCGCKHLCVVEAELNRLRKKIGDWADRTAECSEEECGKTCCVCIAGEMRREAAKGDGK